MEAIGELRARIHELPDFVQELASKTIESSIPDDFLNLHGFPLKMLDHDVATMTPVNVAIIAFAEHFAKVSSARH